MIEIHRIAENTVHDSSFKINRPTGYPVYLLILVLSPARFEVDGEWVDTPSDSIVLYKPRQKHCYAASGGEYRNHWMHFSSNTPILPDRFPFGKPIHMHQSADYYNLFHMLHNEYYRLSPHRGKILNNLTTVILDKLFDESSHEAYPDIYYKLAALREQIYNAPSQPWSIDEMAAGLNISANYLHTLYRQYFKTTCIQDVIQSRTQYATELLTSNTKPIKEIAELCGYQSTEHFIRQFKTVTGTTPNRYRNANMLK